MFAQFLEKRTDHARAYAHCFREGRFHRASSASALGLGRVYLVRPTSLVFAYMSLPKLRGYIVDYRTWERPLWRPPSWFMTTLWFPVSGQGVEKHYLCPLTNFIFIIAYDCFRNPSSTKLNIFLYFCLHNVLLIFS